MTSREEIHARQLPMVQGSLQSDEGRHSHHGTYARRRELEQEAAAAAVLYPRPRRAVSNVVPVRERLL